MQLLIKKFPLNCLFLFKKQNNIPPTPSSDPIFKILPRFSPLFPSYIRLQSLSSLLSPTLPWLLQIPSLPNTTLTTENRSHWDFCAPSTSSLLPLLFLHLNSTQSLIRFFPLFFFMSVS